MKIELLVNGVSVFSGENEKEEIGGKLKREDAHIGLYLMGKKGSPFTKIFSCQLPEKVVNVKELPELPKQALSQAIALFTPMLKQPEKPSKILVVKK